jgi:hypothetical protein
MRSHSRCAQGGQNTTGCGHWSCSSWARNASQPFPSVDQQLQASHRSIAGRYRFGRRRSTVAGRPARVVESRDPHERTHVPTWLWIVIIVILVLALLGYFRRGR